VTLLELAKREVRDRRWLAWGYLGASIMAYLSPAVLFAFSAYLLSKSALRPGILTLGVAIGSVRFFALSRGASQYGERMAGHALALEFGARLRVALFEALLVAVPYRIPTSLFGETLATLDGDVDAAQNLALRFAGPLLGMLVASVLSIIIAAWLWSWLAVVVAVAAIVSLVVVPAMGYLLNARRAPCARQARAAASSDLLDLVDLAEEASVLGVAEALRARLDASLELTRSWRRRLARSQLLLAASASLTEALAVAAALFVGEYALANHGLAPTEIGVIPFLIVGLFQGVSVLATSATNLPDEQASLTRLRDLVTYAAPSAIAGSRTTDANCSIDPEAANDIVFDHVSFSYPQATNPVIEELSFALAPSGRMLITGPSGSGKSTIASLIAGAWKPTSGRVLVGGCATTSLDEEQLARVIGYLPHDPYAFEATLAANLRLARSSATDAELEDALAQVGLHHWYRRLPKGLESHVSRRSFSTGELQRLGLARIVLSRRATLVLDEPTASLDEDQEDRFFELVTHLFPRATLVVITHSERVVARLAADLHLLTPIRSR